MTVARRIRTVTALLFVALLGSVLVANEADATVHNISLKLASGSLVLGDTPSEPLQAGSAAFKGTWNDATGAVKGTLTIKPQDVTVSGQNIHVVMTQIGDATGKIDKKTGFTKITSAISVKLENPLLGDNCNISPINLNLTSGAAGGAPFNFSNGTVKVAGAGFTVPVAEDCGALTGLINDEANLPTNDTSALFGFKQIAKAPSRPAKPVAKPGNKRATVSWTPPASGGALITSYKAVSTPGNKGCTTDGFAHSCVVTGLQNGVKYTFTVKARNFVGWSPQSVPSNAVKPTA